MLEGFAAWCERKVKILSLAGEVLPQLPRRLRKDRQAIDGRPV